MLEDTNSNDNQDSNPGGGGQSDIDRLRSVKDREIADLQRQITTMSQQLAEISAPAEAVKYTGDLSFLDTDDPAVIPVAKKLAQQLGVEIERANRRAAYIDQAAKDYATTAMALQVAAEHGGDWQEHKRALTKAKNQAELDVLVKEIALEQREKKARTGGGEKRPNPDEGRGSGTPDARTKIRDKLASYDMSTLEGVQKFLQDEAAIKRELRAVNGG